MIVSTWGENMLGYLSLDIFYLFLEAHSFPRATLSENCSLLGTDNREFTKPRRRRRGQRRQKMNL